MQAILVSENDEVFGLGANGSGCLGLGEMVSTMFPKKIESLCYKVNSEYDTILSNQIMIRTFLCRKLSSFVMEVDLTFWP